MKIDYSKILKNNMINVFKDVLKNIEKEGLKDGHHLYITFKTNNSKVEIPKWLKEKFPNDITILIQYEFWNLVVEKDYFKITLSFNDIKSDLKVPFETVISFTDPYANFGLKLINDKKNQKQISKSLDKSKNKKKELGQNNVIEFNKFKKN